MNLRPESSSPLVRLFHLSHARRRLVGLMQSLHYGRLEQIKIIGGEPVFTPPSSPTVTRDLKLAADGPAPVKTAGDYALKKQVIELLECLTALKDGVIPCIEVKGGLPFLVQLREPVA